MVFKVRDFLTDEDFINYVLDASSGSASKWDAYFDVHPECVSDAEEAIAILLAPADVESGISKEECTGLKDRIIGSINSFNGQNPQFM